MGKCHCQHDIRYHRTEPNGDVGGCMFCTCPEYFEDSGYNCKIYPTGKMLPQRTIDAMIALINNLPAAQNPVMRDVERTYHVTLPYDKSKYNFVISIQCIKEKPTCGGSN